MSSQKLFCLLDKYKCCQFDVFSGPDDAETFEMELSGFLREFGV